MHGDRVSKSSTQKELVACLLFRGEAPIAELAEACFRFTPQIAVRDDAVFLEIGGSLRLFSEESLFLRISSLARRFGCGPRVAFGGDAAAALALARFGCATAPELPLEALADYTDPFRRDEDACERAARMATMLRKLGLAKLGDFAKLPLASLASRFGAEGAGLGMRVQRSLAGELRLAWPRFRPPERIIEELDLHESAEIGPCAELEPLLFLMKTLADRAMARLRGRGRRAAVVELELDLEKNARQIRKRELRIELPMPQGSAAGLLPILRERLACELSRAPLSSAVAGLRFKVPETAPGHAAQRDLFHSKEDDAEAWDALVGRLCQRLGKDRAFLAIPVDRYLPECSWMRSLDAASADPSPEGPDLPPRPARVLKKAQPIRREGDCLVHGMDGRRWRVAEWHGPERISGEWWWDPRFRGFNRDYYRVVTAAGEQLWIFSVAQKPELYLHGYFD